MGGSRPLGSTELRRAFAGVLELGGLREINEFPAVTAQLLKRLIPCDISSYNAVDPIAGEAVVVADPPESVFAGGSDALGELIDQNPLVEYYARTGDGSALRISDFITRRELHRTDLYDQIYRPIGLETQLAVVLPNPKSAGDRPAGIIGLTVGRDRRDFTAAERDLLELMRPHLALAHDRLSELQQLQTALSELSDDRSHWLVLAADDGTAAWATPTARERLQITIGAVLPQPLRSLLSTELARAREHRRRPPHGSDRIETVDIDGWRGSVRIVAHASEGLHALHIRPVAGPPTAGQLRALGLTTRQAEVLELVMRGNTARRMAEILTLSPRTIEKHLEAIYDRLGVSTRAEAIVYAFRTLAS